MNSYSNYGTELGMNNTVATHDACIIHCMGVMHTSDFLITYSYNEGFHFKPATLGA